MKPPRSTQVFMAESLKLQILESIQRENTLVGNIIVFCYCYFKELLWDVGTELRWCLWWHVVESLAGEITIWKSSRI